jgi:aspartokinase
MHWVTSIFYANNSFQVEVINGCSILAAVGLRMASTPGVSAILFDALAKVFCISWFGVLGVPLMLGHINLL